MEKVDEILKNIGITVIGQPVVDHEISLNDPIKYGGLTENGVYSRGRDHELIFNEDFYIATKDKRTTYFFGPLGTEPLYPGKKYTIKTQEWSSEINGHDVAELGYPDVKLGGGGPNVLQTLYRVFGGINLEFIGPYSKQIDPIILGALRQRVKEKISGHAELIPLYDTSNINIVIEKVGPKDDRIILKSPVPYKLLTKSYPPHGKTMMVNSLYNNSLAIDGIADSVKNDRLCVLALTKSLCRKDQFSEEEKSYLRERHGKETFKGINSVYDFLVKLILSESDPILIMNEDELENLTGIKIIEDKDKHVYFDLVLNGLKKTREIQNGHKPRIYFTMGPNGSLCLDENDVLHYHGVTDTDSKEGKNAIGDTYAAAILACEHIKRTDREDLPTSKIINIAATTADSAISIGVENICEDSIDAALTNSHKKYIELGPVNEIREIHHTVDDIGSEVIDGLTYEKIAKTGKRLGSHLVLREVLGEKYLTVSDYKRMSENRGCVVRC